MLGRCNLWPLAMLLILLTASCGNEATPANGGSPRGESADALPAPPVGPAMDISGTIPKRALVQRDLSREYPQERSETSTLFNGFKLMPTTEEPLAWGIYRF